MATDHFCLKWNNFHNSIVSAFESLQSSEDLVDVTLMCEGRNVKAHKVILSACSPYFRNLFKETPCQHPIIILKDVLHCDLLAILQFMYQGEVLITQDGLSSFLKTAELLQVSGLAGNTAPGTGGASIQENTVVPTQITPPAPPLVPIPVVSPRSPPSPRPTINKHSEVVVTKQAEKENAPKKDEKVQSRFEPETEPMQSCSYQQAETVVIKTESDEQDFEEMDYNMIAHENLDDPGPATEEQSILERSLKAQELEPKAQYMKEQFNKLLSTIIAAKSKNSTFYTRNRYNEMLRKIKNAQTQTSKTTRTPEYYRVRNYGITVEGGKEWIVHPRILNKPPQFYICSDDIFDVIHSTHMAIGHGGRTKMLTQMKRKYRNITTECVLMYLKLCDVCQRRFKGEKNDSVDNSEMEQMNQMEFVKFEEDEEDDFNNTSN